MGIAAADLVVSTSSLVAQVAEGGVTEVLNGLDQRIFSIVLSSVLVWGILVGRIRFHDTEVIRRLDAIEKLAASAVERAEKTGNIVESIARKGP